MPTPVEREILLHLLVSGDDTSGNIAEETDRNRATVSRRLSSLEDEGLVRNKGRGVYALTLEGIAATRALERDDDEASSQ
jgi:DNA-binding IclR family transcriptional regulator